MRYLVSGIAVLFAASLVLFTVTGNSWWLVVAILALAAFTFLLARKDKREEHKTSE